MAAKEDNQEKQKLAQQAYLELQLINSQLKQFQKNIQLFDEQAMELRVVIQNLEDFRGCAQNSNVLIPVANGIFAKGTLKDSNELIVNVGAETAVAKDVPSTQKLLEERIAEVQKQRDEMIAEMQRIAAHAQQVEQQLVKLLE